LLRSGSSSPELPRFILIAGANGSGKSTFSRNLRDQGVAVVDPDAIQRESGLSTLGAGRATILRARNLIDDRVSFSLESTIAGKHHLDLIRLARERRFTVEMVYVGTGNVEINLERIRDRVIAGGHNVPEPDVRRRAMRSIQNAPHTAALCNFVIVFDNSGDALLPIVHRAQTSIRIYNPAPPWSQALQVALQQQARTL
jgi:predicted ABC-type ATPase